MSEEIRIVETVKRLPKYNPSTGNEMLGTGVLFMMSSFSFFGGSGYFAGLSGIDFVAWVAVFFGFTNSLFLLYLFYSFNEMRSNIVLEERVIERYEAVPPKTLTVNTGTGTKEVRRTRQATTLPNGFVVTGSQADAIQCKVFAPDGSIADAGFSRSRFKGDGNWSNEEFSELTKGLTKAGHIVGEGREVKQWTDAGISWLWGSHYEAPHPIDGDG